MFAITSSFIDADVLTPKKCYMECNVYCQNISGAHKTWCKDYCNVQIDNKDPGNRSQNISLDGQNCIAIEVPRSVETVCIFDGVCYDAEFFRYYRLSCC